MKKTLLIVAILLAVLAAAGAVWHFYIRPQKMVPEPEPQAVPSQTQQEPLTPSEQEPATPSEQTQQPKHHIKTDQSDKKETYEPEREANPLLVGVWCEDVHPQHYKAYYDDPCDEETYFWGKEWNEADNVYEEDLTYHGNGWFKWSKTQNELTEIYVSERSNILVPNHYRIDKLNDSTFVYTSFRITQNAKNQQQKVAFRVYGFHRR